MAIQLKHSKTVAKADGVDNTVVQPSDWNATHTLTAAAGKVLGTVVGSTTVSELPLEIDASGNLNISGTIAISSNKGTAGQVLVSGGASTPPSWGSLGVAVGGTGVTTLTGIVKGNGTSAFTAAVAGTDYVVPSGLSPYVTSTSLSSTLTSYATTSYVTSAVAGANGITLLGTIATTSGNNIPLSGINLTGCKFVYAVCENVDPTSSTINNSQFALGGANIRSSQSIGDNYVIFDLTFSMAIVYSITGMAFAASTLTAASTSIIATTSPGGFQGGTIRLYSAR